MLLNPDRFESEVLASAAPVLVDFYAAWCGPCRLVAPAVARLAREGHSVCKLDVQARPDLADRYQVTALPTLVVLQNGKELNRLVGIQSYEVLKTALRRAHTSTSDGARG